MPETSSQTLDVLEESEEEMMREERKEQVGNEREILEEIPLPGAPLSEQERRKQLLNIPRQARAAI
eukprot:11848212-Karenia_brevis.AAC.1